MWADALAIARVANSPATGRHATRVSHEGRRRSRTTSRSSLWDPKREFFFPMSKRDEEARTASPSRRHDADVPDRQVRRQPARPRGDRLRPLAVQPARRRKGTRSAWKFLMDADVLRRPLRPDHRRAARPDVPRHEDAAAGGAASRGPTRRRRRSRRWRTCFNNYEQYAVTKARLRQAAQDLHDDPPQGRQARTSPKAPTRTPARGRGTTATTTANTTSTRGTATWSSPAWSASGRATTTRSRSTRWSPTTGITSPRRRRLSRPPRLDRLGQDGEQSTAAARDCR